MENGSLKVRAFGRTFILGTLGLDMARSTWDGTPLSAFVGKDIDLSGSHTLVLIGR